MMRKTMTGLAMAALVTAVPANAQFRETGVTSAAPTTPTTTSAASDGAMNRSGGFLGGIFGCSADGNKQGTAAVIGGLAGAFLGNRIAGRGSRALGTLLGGAVGAAAGSAVGCKLQKNDRDKAEAAAQRAFETGQSQTWTNEETGASGRFDIANSASASGVSGLKFADGVDLAGSYDKIGNSYTTRAAANVRAAPNSSAKIRGTLPAGQALWIPAQVKGQPWMLISENGVAQGYVHNTLLTKTVSTAAANCKLVTQSVSVPGEAEQSETYQACKGSDGAWTMTRV